MTDEPIRDPGPYENPDQAMRQYANFTHNMPADGRLHQQLVLNEAYLKSGVRPTEFERSYLTAMVMDNRFDPLAVQVISSLLHQAYIAGRQAADPEDRLAFLAAADKNAHQAHALGTRRASRLTLTEDDIAARSSQVIEGTGAAE